MQRSPFEIEANGWQRLRVAMSVAVGALVLALCASAIVAGPAQAVEFTSSSLDFHAADNTRSPGNDPIRQAGARSDLTVSFEVPSEPIDGTTVGVVEQPHRFVSKMPVGFAGTPAGLPTCREASLTGAVNGLAAACPVGSQIGVGVLRGRSLTTGSYAPIYNLVPPEGAPAMFGMNFLGFVVKLVPTLDPSDYSVVVDSNLISHGLPMRGFDTVLWSVPADPSHDQYRVAMGMPLNCVGTNPCTGNTASQQPLTSFLSLPTSCETPLSAEYKIDGWASIGDFDTATLTGDRNDVPFEFTDCENLPFNPQVSVLPSVSGAGEPTGLSFDLTVPQTSSPTAPASAHVRDVSVRLPEGMAISPAGARGLVSCTDADFGKGTDSEIKCPDASKVGKVVIDTPALPDLMHGSVYIASQLSDDPQSGRMFRLFLAGQGSGVTIKLEGGVKADPETGQLTAEFKNNPQQPFSNMKVDFYGGQDAVLVNPDTCGTKTVEVDATAWSGASRELTSQFEVACGRVADKFAPDFQAGTSNPVAAGSGVFSLIGSRTLGDEELKTVRQIKLPEGLLGRVGDVELCAEAAAAVGQCLAASRLGHIQAAAGAGPAPLWVPEAGKAPTSVSLTGPYGGAPYGLSIVVPAQAGPYDLGKVVVRSALHVDERTAQLTAGVDETRVFNANGSFSHSLKGELPRILKGVPLDLREMRVIVDRENFTVNPTNCAQQQITAQAISVTGKSAGLANGFRATDCAKLDFAPRFNARILDKGRKSTLRSFHPRTRFAVAPRKGDANIGGARVVLPSSTLLDQANIGTTCTRDQMAARNCPERSIVGYAKAWSPLLRKAVEGPVYLAANGGVRPLPDLAAVLDGEIRVVLQGEIATQRGGGKARLQNTFRVVPDAPVSRFILTMRGGNKRGLLVNSTDLCRSGERGVAVFHGQNGRTHRLRPRIATTFRGCAKVRRQASRRAAQRQQARRVAAGSTTQEGR